VQLRDPFGNLSPVSTQDVVLDSHAPDLTPLTTSLSLGPMAGTTGLAGVRGTWGATDATSGLASGAIPGACGSPSPGQLASLVPPGGTQTLLLALNPGDRCSLSEDAADRASLTSSSASPLGFVLAVAQEATSHASWNGPWAVTTNTQMSQ